MSEARKGVVVLIVCLIINHVGWIKFSAPQFTYYIDYAQHLLIIGLFVLADRRLDLRVTFDVRWMAAALGAAVLIFLADVVARWALLKLGLLTYGAIFPRATGLLWAFDVTVGVALTGLAEELVYRRSMHDALGRITQRPIVLYVVSSAVFAALHGNQGSTGIVVSFAAGLVLMALYRWSGRLFVPVVAHFLADFIFFAARGLNLRLAAMLP